MVPPAGVVHLSYVGSDEPTFGGEWIENFFTSKTVVLKEIIYNTSSIRKKCQGGKFRYRLIFYKQFVGINLSKIQQNLFIEEQNCEYF